MNVGNVCILIFVFVCIIFAISILLENVLYLFKRTGHTVFLLLNHLNLFTAMSMYSVLYHSTICSFWKVILSILIFDVVILVLMVVKYYVSSYYVDYMDIKNGCLHKVHASKDIRRIKVPKTCNQIAENAINGFPELEKIYFGKNIENLSELFVQNCPCLQTLYFENPNVNYDDNLEKKFKIVIKNQTQY